MAAKFFGQFLLERGVISSPQLLAAIEAQRAANPVLGEIAQELGYLTLEQAERINEKQRREDRRFGDIACELGLLDAGQVEALLARQKAGRRLFGEILVEQGAVTPEQLAAELALHQRDRDEAVQALALGVDAHLLGDVLTSAINNCSKLFPRIVHSPCLYSAMVEDAAALGVGEVVVQVRIHGDRELTLTLACDKPFMYAVSVQFLGIAPGLVDDALARDALGEFLNVLMGYVIKDVLALDASYRATPPSFGASVDALFGATPAPLAVRMGSDLGAFGVLVQH